MCLPRARETARGLVIWDTDAKRKAEKENGKDGQMRNKV